MNFTFTEVNGEQPISNWVREKLIEHVRIAYGVEIKVEVNEKYANKTGFTKQILNDTSI